MYSEANEDNENDWGVVNDDNSSYLPPRCSLYPFLQIILRHSCQFGHAIRQSFLEGNLRV